MLVDMVVLSLKDKKTEIATSLNKKINLPFVSEEKEQVLAEKVVDALIDIVEGVLSKGKA
tara:strand:+ start:85 stop:264 length:180 start_codon:yes stop_codon:yes gene_type:complete